MPERFTQWDPDLPDERGMVATGIDPEGRRIQTGINDRRTSRGRTGRHRFLGLGEGLFVIKAMAGNPSEAFDEVVTRSLGERLPTQVVEAWDVVREIRNAGSHVEAIGFREYKFLLDEVLGQELIGPILTIKQTLQG
jgi:hypothetical protein